MKEIYSILYSRYVNTNHKEDQKEKLRRRKERFDRTKLDPGTETRTITLQNSLFETLMTGLGFKDFALSILFWNVIMVPSQSLKVIENKIIQGWLQHHQYILERFWLEATRVGNHDKKTCMNTRKFLNCARNSCYDCHNFMGVYLEYT